LPFNLCFSPFGADPLDSLAHRGKLLADKRLALCVSAYVGQLSRAFEDFRAVDSLGAPDFSEQSQNDENRILFQPFEWPYENADCHLNAI